MATAAAALFGFDIIFLISFPFLNHDHEWFAHPVSDYGVGKTAGLFQTYVILGSIAAPLLAWLGLAVLDVTFAKLSACHQHLSAAGDSRAHWCRAVSQ